METGKRSHIKQKESQRNPMETELDLSRKYSRPYIPNASIGAEKEVNQFLLDEFKNEVDVKLVGQSPDYDGFRGFYLSYEGGLSTVSKRIYGWAPKQSRGAIKHHIYFS